MVRISVQFDSPNNTYYPGQWVRCKVITNASNSFKARSISLRFLGHCQTKWTESESYQSGGKTKYRSVTYTGNEEYFRRYFYLAGRKDGPEIQFPAGNTSYEEQIQLPLTLPSSYEHHLGWVRYEVKVNIDIAWAFDETFKELFNVISPIDLNQYAHLREPSQDIKTKSLCCCCCESGPLSVILNMPRTGWTPQDPIKFAVEVDNLSNTDIYQIKVKLMHYQTFYVRHPRSKSRGGEFKLSERIFNDQIRRLQKRVYAGELTLEPDYNPINMNFCGLIESRYTIEATAKVDSCSSNLTVTTGITIGTIPFVVLQMPSAPSFLPNPVLGIVTEQPLPSYDEIVKDGERVKLLPQPDVDTNGAGPSAPPLDDIAPPTFEEFEKARMAGAQPPDAPLAPPEDL